MKKKILKAITVAALCTVTFIALAVPCLAIESNSSVINKTNINLQSILYTDNSYSYSYPVSGFDYPTPVTGNNENVILYGYNTAETGRIGVYNTVNYGASAQFQLRPFTNGASNESFYYPRMLYFGESYMPILRTDIDWGTITFNYSSNFLIEELANEKIFMSVTYQLPIYEGSVVKRFEERTAYTTFVANPTGRNIVVDLYDCFKNLATGNFGNLIDVVHINSMKITRVNDNGLLPVDSVNISGLSYYTSDGDDLSPYYTRFQDAVNGNMSNNELNVDFTTWIGTSIGGFLSFELIPGLSLWAVFIGIFGIMILLAFLKYFAGG